MDLARLRGEAPRQVLGLSLGHWDGVRFDETARVLAEYRRGEEVGRIGDRASKDAGGMDVIANLIAMVARRA